MIDDLERVILLALDIFVLEDAVGIPHAGDIDTIIDISRAAQAEIERVLSGDQRPRPELAPDRSWDTQNDTARDPRSMSENEEKAAS